MAHRKGLTVAGVVVWWGGGGGGGGEGDTHLTQGLYNIGLLVVY